MENFYMAKVEQFYDAESLDSELKNSYSGKFTRYTSAEKEYIVTEVESEAEAIQAVRDIAEDVYLNMILQGFSISERLGDNAWKVSASYAYVQNESTDDGEIENESTFQFDTSGGSKHINQSLKTISKYPSSAPDFSQAINVGDNNSVSGVDITMPTYSFSETHYFKRSKVSTSFKKKIMELTGKVNSSSFKGFDAGEVLFLGASGTRRGTGSKDLWEITFKFAVSPNTKNLKVGDISVGSKKGWEYMWVKYQSDIDNSKENIIAKPVGIYIEQVYEYANLRGLGIGS